MSKSLAEQAREWLRKRGKIARIPEPEVTIPATPADKPVLAPEHRAVSFALAVGDRWRHRFTYLALDCAEANDPAMRPDGSTYTLRLRDGEIEKTFQNWTVDRRREEAGRVYYRMAPPAKVDA